MTHVIAYDIEDDRVRARVATLLAGCGRRVQRSVFECRLGERDLKELFERLRREIAGAPEAEVRAYRVCDRCLETSFGIGRIKPVETEQCFIV